MELKSHHLDPTLSLQNLLSFFDNADQPCYFQKMLEHLNAAEVNLGPYENAECVALVPLQALRSFFFLPVQKSYSLRVLCMVDKGRILELMNLSLYLQVSNDMMMGDVSQALIILLSLTKNGIVNHHTSFLQIMSKLKSPRSLLLSLS